MSRIPSFLVRFAGEQDLDGVLALYRELRPHDPPLENAMQTWRHVLARPEVRVVVADREGQLAATCMIALVPNLASGGRPFGVIEHVVTLEACRGQGLAKAVLQAALDFAWEQRCCKVLLLSGAARETAHCTYLSLGFDGDAERGFVIKAPR
ncbi:GNAT family N-acetyltransferase [Chitinibacteraceae bacterium HSL-7]